MCEPTTGKCQGEHCNATITWGKTLEGKSIPLVPLRTIYHLDEEGVATPLQQYGVRKGTNPPVYVSHFETCPDAKNFGRGRRA